MGLVSQALSRLYGGISEQAPAQRFSYQHEDQKNIHNSVKSGPTKRMPTEHGDRIMDSPPSNVYTHTYNRDLNERYTIIVSDGAIRVFDLVDNTEKVVGTPHGTGYLNSDDPHKDFSLVTIGDYTFVVNKNVQVQKLSDTTGGSLTGSKQDFTAIIRIDNPDSGEIYEVAGDYRSSFDNYYVIRQGGVWLETIRPGEPYKLDPATMPHGLVRNADDTFTFKQLEWAERQVGDLQSVPFPSFVGDYIQHIFYYRNRLCVLTPNNIIMSRTGEFFNFFIRTATDLLDTDPVDVRPSSTNVVQLRSVAPHNQTLMVNADQSQFVLNGGEILSPKTVSIDPTTGYTIRRHVDPVLAGPNVYFATESGSFTALREYYVEENTVSNKATDVTGQVPSLLPSDVTQLATNSNFGYLFAIADSKPDTIFVYQWHWRGNKKIMSAWNYWKVPGEVLSIASVDSDLVYVSKHPDGAYINRINLDMEAHDEGLPFYVRLDRRVTLTGEYDSGTDTTTWTLPYPEDTGTAIEVVKDGTNGNESGVRIMDTTRPSDTTVSAPGDHSGSQCILGIPYDAMTKLTQIFMRDSEDSTILGRIQLRRISVGYVETGYFEVEVTRNGGSQHSMPISPSDVDPETGRVLGSIDWSLGTPTVSAGTAQVPILSASERAGIILRNPSPLPSSWHQVEWQGEFVADTRV